MDPLTYKMTLDRLITAELDRLTGKRDGQIGRRATC